MAKKKVGVKPAENKQNKLATNEIVVLILYALWIHVFFWQTTSGPYNAFVFADIISAVFILAPITIIAFIVTLLSQIISKKFYSLSLWLYTSFFLVLIFVFNASPTTLNRNHSLPICLLIIALLGYFALKPIFKKDK